MRSREREREKEKRGFQHGTYISDGNSEIGAQTCFNLDYLIGFKVFGIESSHNSDFFSSEKIYLPSYVRNMF